jgi:hypothetical protein
MGYRLRVERPERDTYSRIFQSTIEARGLNYDSALLETVFTLYDRDQRKMAGCEPRDLIDRFMDICRFENRPVRLTQELLELAWVNYFGHRPR